MDLAVMIWWLGGELWVSARTPERKFLPGGGITGRIGRNENPVTQHQRLRGATRWRATRQTKSQTMEQITSGSRSVNGSRRSSTAQARSTTTPCTASRK